MGGPKKETATAANVSGGKQNQVVDITQRLASAKAHPAHVIPRLEHPATISEFLDRSTYAAMSKVTKGASPAAFGEA